MPIGENRQFEAGIRIESEDDITDYKVFDNIDNVFVEDLNQSNLFQYKEQISALYTQYGVKVDETDADEEDKNWLDNLLDSIDNLSPSTGEDYTQYVCDEAYTGKPLTVTTVGFTGGLPLPNGGGSIPEKRKIRYSIDDITVTEGDFAKFTVTRSGYTDIASSCTWKTLKE